MIELIHRAIQLELIEDVSACESMTLDELDRVFELAFKNLNSFLFGNEEEYSCAIKHTSLYKAMNTRKRKLAEMMAV